MKNVVAYIRLNEWYDSKVPMFLAALLYFKVVFSEDIGVGIFIITFFCYALFVSSCLAFGYVINDYADKESDIKAGKEKIIIKMSDTQIFISLIAILFVGTLPFLFFAKNKIVTIIYIVLMFVLGSGYSIRPMRFKERGILGLIICALTQRVLPLLGIMFLVKIKLLPLLFWAVISLFSGLRYILIHQIEDKEHDLKSNTHTYITRNSTAKYGKRVIVLSLITEIVIAGLLSVPFIYRSAWVLLLFVLYLIYEGIIIYFVERRMKKSALYSFSAVPLESFYNVYVPFFLAISFAVSSRNIIAAIVPTFICVCAVRVFLGKGAIIFTFFKTLF